MLTSVGIKNIIRNMKIQIMILLLFITWLAQATESPSNVTFAPPPPINTSIIYNLTASHADSKLILSPALENIDFTMFMAVGTPYTNMTLTVFNRSAPGYQSMYTLTVPGMWNHVESSPQTFSCTIAFQSNQKLLGAVLFDREKGELKVMGQIPLVNLTGGDNVTLDQIRQFIIVSQNCSALSFTNPPAQTRFFRSSDNFSIIHQIPLPSGWSLQAYASDITAVISNNKLYTYNSSAFEIQQKYVFPKAYLRYEIKHNKNSIVVSAADSIAVNNLAGPPVNMTNYTVYIFNNLPGGCILIDKFVVEGVMEQGQGDGAKLVVSPKITKVSLGFFDHQGNFRIKMKHIDYMQNKAVQLELTDPAHFGMTIRNSNLTRQLYFGDFFIVARNGSAFDPNDTHSHPVEEVYQFISDKVVLFRDRSLLNSSDNTELLSFIKVFVDQTFSDKLIVLNLYQINNATFSLEEFVYGNLASTNIIEKKVTPFISFVEPPHQLLRSMPHQFQWSYLNQVPGITNLTLVSFNFNSPKHIQFKSYDQNGSWHLLFQNQECLIGGSPNMTTLFKRNRTTSEFQFAQDLTPLLAGANVTNQTIWAASMDCSRLRIDSSIFFMPPRMNLTLVNNSQTLAWTAIDDNLTTIISANSSLWRFQPQRMSFVMIFIPDRPFPPDSMIRCHEDRLIIWAVNTSSAWVFSFLTANKSFVICLNYFFSQFTATPKVMISPNLTKVLIIGPSMQNNETMTVSNLFFVNHTAKSSTKITFPAQALKDPQNSFIGLDQLFIYIREIPPKAPKVSTPRQSVYYFSRETVLVKIWTKNIQLGANSVWQKTLIVRNLQGQHFVMTETLEGSTMPKTRVVIATQITGEESNYRDNQNSPSYAVKIEGEKVTICPVGCTDCQCLNCLSGYIKDESTSTCRPCPYNCLSCLSSQTQACEECITGSFLNSTNQCQPCHQKCIACNISATFCTICPPGQFPFNQTCQNCPENCFNCSDANTCIKCKQGFVTTDNNQCRSCSSGCTECSVDNITKCTGCGAGLQSKDSKCSPCPQKCKQCNNDFCSVCIDGYVPDNNGACIARCQLPCLTCEKNKPTSCLTCQGGSAVVNKTCQIDLTCNTNSSCTSCGQGLNYILVSGSSGATCQPCPSIQNCIQCDSVNSYKCSICKKWFYVNSGQCAACNSTCTSCKSDTICTGCIQGYTLMDGYTQGTCLKCQYPCKTCEGSATYCTSCADNYTRQNWKCRNNVYIKFKFTVNDNEANCLKNIDNIVKGLLKLLGQSETNTQSITFTSISSGSTTFAGSAQPSNPSQTSTVSTDFSKKLASGIPYTSYSVSGVQVSAVGTSSSQSQSSTNVGMIVGITLGVVFLVVIVVLLVVYYKRKQTTDTPPEGSGGSDIVFVQNNSPGFRKVNPNSDTPNYYQPNQNNYDLEKQV